MRSVQRPVDSQGPPGCRTRPPTHPQRGRQPVGADGSKRGVDTGFDGNKKVKGRKRHLMVAPLGFSVKVFVAAAHSGEREGLAVLAMSRKGKLPRLKQIAGGTTLHGQDR